MPVQYLTDHFPEAKFIIKNVPRFGILKITRGQSPSGYGKKITTDYMAIINKRKHRVYCVCYSNAGSLYVIVKGQSYYLHDYDLDEVRGK